MYSWKYLYNIFSFSKGSIKSGNAALLEMPITGKNHFKYCIRSTSESIIYVDPIPNICIRILIFLKHHRCLNFSFHMDIEIIYYPCCCQYFTLYDFRPLVPAAPPKVLVSTYLTVLFVCPIRPPCYPSVFIAKLIFNKLPHQWIRHNESRCDWLWNGLDNWKNESKR